MYYYLGFNFARTVHYFKDSYAGDDPNVPSPAQKIVETDFHRGDVPTEKGEPANPDPRAGRAEQVDTFRPEGSGCKNYQTPNTVQTSGYSLSDDDFCLVVQNSTEWAAYEPAADFKTWPNTTDNYWARPLWIRQNSQSHWEEGVEYRQRLFYDLTPQTGQNRFGGQDGVQFGNVTTAEEGFVTNANTAQEGFERLRATAYDYNPHVVPDDANTQTDETVYITGLPIRTRLYDETDTCHAETRSIYTFGAQGNNYLSPPTASVVVKTEQALEGCFPNEGSIAEYNEPNGEWAITQYFHDPYGNVVGERSLGEAADESQDIEISMEYDDVYHLFPLRRWNANAPDFEEIFKYYGVNGPEADSDGAFWGAMRRYCDVAGVCTRQDYDEFGRRTRLWTGGNAVEQGGNGDEGINTQYWYYYRYQDPQQPALQTNVVVEWNEPRCQGNFVRRHYNGLGQLVKQQMPDDYWRIGQLDGDGSCEQADDFNEIDTDYEYDALGNQARASVPYRRSGDWVGSGLNWNAGYTESTYDAINRPTLTEAPNGEKVRYRYGSEAILLNGIVYPLRVAVAEGLGQIAEGARILSWQGTDVLGRLTSTRTQDWDNNAYEWVDEAEVELTYDPADRLLETDLPVGAQATMSYDTGGRKTAMDDPDLGQWAYEYDRQGRLTQQTDARGCVADMEYDPELGRLTRKVYGNGDGSGCYVNSIFFDEVLYEYDGDHNGDTIRSRGQLTKVINKRTLLGGDVSYQKRIWYNARGQLATERVAIGGSNSDWEMGYYYDAYLRPIQLRYPDDEWVTTWLNSRGLPSTLATGPTYDPNNPPVPIVDNVGYTEAGQLAQMHMPRGSDDLWRRNTYYSWTDNPGNGNRRLNEILVGTTQQNHDLLRLQHTYDSFGNLDDLTEEYDGATPSSENFYYDLQMRVGGAFGQQFDWAPSGNFNSFDNVNYAYDNSHVHAVEALSGVDRYDYDANGNMTVRDKGQPEESNLDWGPANRLRFVDLNPGGSGPTEYYEYDDGGRRVYHSLTDQSVKFYPFPHYEVTEASGTAVAAATDAASQAAANPELEALIPPPIPDFLLNLPPPTAAELNASLDVEIGDPPGPQCPLELDELVPCVLPLPDPIEPVVEAVEAAAPAVDFVGGNTTFLPLVNGGGAVEAAASSQSTTVTKYYFLGMQRVALQEDGDFRYVHSDHLGSTAIETDLTGSVTAERRYFAFGGERASSGNLLTENQFTSQKLDGTGLYYYGARYYDPEIGQFISPDTIVPSAGEVFAYNRYMYTFGNPLNYVDPSGNDPWWIGDRIPSWPVNYPDQREYVADYLHQSGLGPQYASDITPADGASLYLGGSASPTPIRPVGGVEYLYNFSTGDITLFGVLGAEGGPPSELLEVAGQFNAVYNLGETGTDNLAYSGPFVVFNLTVAVGPGATVGGAYTPNLDGSLTEYFLRDPTGAYSLGAGPAGGFAVSPSAALVEYIPIITLSPDGTGQTHLGWYLYENENRWYIADSLAFALRAFGERYGFDPSQYDYPDPGEGGR